MRFALLFLTCLLALHGIAQRDLSGSRHSSAYTYVYRINTTQALKLNQKKTNVVGSEHLKQKIDSFATGGQMPTLKNGNYLLVKAVENKIWYEVKTIGDLQIKIIKNNYDLAVFIHDKNGAPVTDAVVHIGNSKLAYDPATRYYSIKQTSKKGLMRIIHGDIAYFADIASDQYGTNNYFRSRRYNSNPWAKIKQAFPVKYVVRLIDRLKDDGYSYRNFFTDKTRHEKKFNGYMVFNKPIYRPGDTVRLKAFITTKKGKGVNRKMILRLTDNGLSVDTILATINPYRRGGYEFEFKLSETLDLALDDRYQLTLEETKSSKYDIDKYDGDLDDDEYALKRKVVLRNKFEYEEYELKSIKFEVRADKKSSHSGESNFIYLRASDENGLPVADGRVDLTMKSLEDNSQEFYKPSLFLPDTLLMKSLTLDPVGETRFAIPDSIFPDVSLNYQIICHFLNSNNESQTETLYMRYECRQNKIIFKLISDSLLIDKSLPRFSQQGKATSVGSGDNIDADYETVVIIALGPGGDTIQRTTVNLPVTIKLNPYAILYKAIAGPIVDSFLFKNSADLVIAAAIRTVDSLRITLDNRHHLPAWYTLFAGKKPIQRGIGDTVIYMGRTQTKNNYNLSLQYIFGNQVYTKDYSFPFLDKELVLDIKQPEFVYPGQSAEIEINLKDISGKPVAAADITAYAFTDKFKENVYPTVPYYGKGYRPRKPKNTYAAVPRDEKILQGMLHWIKWSEEMRLDTIEYYKFLYPSGIYTNHQPVADGITQIAPFVVQGGVLQQIHMLYIDEQPVFFSRSQDLVKYSFAVTPGKHAIRIRTTKALIHLDSINAIAGMKTYFSIDADSTSNHVRIVKQPAKLSTYETMLWSRYMVLIQSDYGENLVYLRQQERLWLVSQPRPMFHSGRYLVPIGPLKNQSAELKVKTEFTQPFEVESGYHYIISKGLIKQKQLLSPVISSQKLFDQGMETHFRDLVLTEKEIDSLWQDYLYTRSRNEELFGNSWLNSFGNGKLKIKIDGPDGVDAQNRVDDADGLDSQNRVDAPDVGNEPLVKQVILFRQDNSDFIRIYKGTMRDFGYLTPGGYRLFFLLKNDDYYIRDGIDVKKNGLNYYHIIIDKIKKKDSTSILIAQTIESKELYNYQQHQEQLTEITQSFNTAYLDPATFTRVITGQVRNEKDEPLQGAAVYIKTSTIGTVTDAQGFFKLAVPEVCSIVITLVGYSSVELQPRDAPLLINLKTQNSELNEVVVVGYGVKKKSALTGALANVTTNESSGFLSGRVAGIQIRGAATINGSNTPLIIVDGLPYSGKLEDVDKSQYGEPRILTADAATAIYGSVGINGAIIITSAKKTNEVIEPMQDARNSIRRNFRDDAYWQPKLLTDRNGKASFRVSFPDDITNWRTFVIAMAGQKRTGYSTGNIRSFKALSAMLSLPAFLVAGDSVNLIAKTQNYLADTITVNRIFRIDDKIASQERFTLTNAKIDTFSVTVQVADSLEFSYTIQKEDGYADGELRKIEVTNPGVLETVGFFAALEDDTSFILPARTTMGEITIHAESGAIPVLLEEIERINNYEYYCNEQMASKLKALLQQRNIYTQLKTKFSADKQINELIRRLEKSKSSEGLWGWWPNNKPQAWISMHVLEALLLAEQAGFRNTINKQALIDQLVYKIDKAPDTEKISSLRLLQLLGAKLNYAAYLDTLQNYRYRLRVPDQLELMALRQKVALSINLDSAVKTYSRTLMGNIYWGHDGFNLVENSIQHTIRMYKLMRTAGDYGKELKKIRNYFFEKRRESKWRNTYESSLIIETLLPDLLKEGVVDAKPTLEIMNASDEPGNQPAAKPGVISAFPYTWKLAVSDKVTITKRGVAPVYFTSYQQGWNSNPAKVESEFTVKTAFERNGTTITSSLTAGQAVDLKVFVNVRADGDYVMIEIPIPSGCSYDSKPQSWRNNEVHREYFKNKVSIFCTDLKKGSYTFTIPLMPRYTGRFTLNPAKTELMYFPVFFGREGLKKIDIK